jgi:hypothetical protein
MRRSWTWRSGANSLYAEGQGVLMTKMAQRWQHGQDKI